MTDISSIKTLNLSFNHFRTDLYFKLWDFLRLTDVTEDEDYVKQLAEIKYNLDPNLYSLALSEKKNVRRFFSKVITQYPYTTTDGKEFEKLIVNWYTAFRTLTSALKRGIDPLFLTTEEIDLLIKSFGFPYPNKISSKRIKTRFLYNLIDFYNRKGSPYVFGEALPYFGLNDVTIVEWWLKKDQTLLSSDNLYFVSQPIYPRSERDTSTFIRRIEYNKFNLDSHWNHTKDIINTLYKDRLITLPSLTPYIGIYCTLDVLKLKTGLSIIHRIIQETYTFWIEYILQNRGTVEDIINDPESSISLNTWYLIGTSAIGSFYEHSGELVKKTTSSWEFIKLEKNDLLFVNSTSTHHINNGETWINTGFQLPISLINNKKYGKLNRPVNLTEFENSYSIFEIILAIGYIFDSLNDTTDTQFVRYNGLYVPIDREVNGVRDNIIDDSNVHEKIYDEWDKINVNVDTWKEFDANYTYLKNNFQDSISRTDTNNSLVAYYNSEVFLNSINGEFKKKIDEYIVNNNKEDLLSSLVVDLERYTRDIAKLVDVPFSFFLFGFSAYSSYQKIIDFFKPYRVRIASFSTFIGIIDRVADFVPLTDIPTDKKPELDVFSGQKRTIKYWIGDQAPGDHSIFDSSTVTDSVEIEQNLVT